MRFPDKNLRRHSVSERVVGGYGAGWGVMRGQVGVGCEEGRGGEKGRGFHTVS